MSNNMPTSFYLSPPFLSPWMQQLAGILPLTALVEFINVPIKLHIFELSGLIPLWNWPVTPAGARLLQATADNFHACCLDREEYSSVLHCIDGRYGDCYPSSTPNTTRLIAASLHGAVTVPNHSPNMADQAARKQSLRLVLLSQKSPLPQVHTKGPSRNLVSHFYSRSTRYQIVSITGWLLWVGAIALSLLCRLHLAAVYLVLLPLTGLVTQATHGGIRRPLVVEVGDSVFQRMVVATSNLNATQWWLFYGDSRVLNSLLNKPLVRASPIRWPRILRILLQVLIAGQWTVAIGSCALQDCNALVMSTWIAMCAITNSYLITPWHCVLDWLDKDCNVMARCVDAEFSSRRAMLSTMVYLNPDTKEGRTTWINPILAPCRERSEWEVALLEFIETGLYPKYDEYVTPLYWWKYIEEGVDMGREIEKILNPGQSPKRNATISTQGTSTESPTAASDGDMA